MFEHLEQGEGFKDAAIQKWSKLGESLGMNASQAEQIATREFLRAVDYARRDMGVDFDSKMGTKFFGDVRPVGDDERITLQLIQECAPLWSKENVSEEDALWFWNLSMIDRALSLRLPHIFRWACFLDYCRRSPGEVTEEVKKRATALTDRIVPSFDLLHPKYYQDSRCHPLPWELIYRASDWYLELVLAFDFVSLESSIAPSDCVNGLIRDHLASGTL